MAEPRQRMLLRSIRVDRGQIAYIKWLLEAHDGIATPTTREGAGDVLDLLVAPDFEDDFNDFLFALSEELECEAVAPPDVPPLGG